MKYVINETVEYEVEADSKEEAAQKFLDAEDIGVFPVTLINREVFEAHE